MITGPEIREIVPVITPSPFQNDIVPDRLPEQAFNIRPPVYFPLLCRDRDNKRPVHFLYPIHELLIKREHVLFIYGDDSNVISVKERGMVFFASSISRTSNTSAPARRKPEALSLSVTMTNLNIHKFLPEVFYGKIGGFAT